MSALLLAALLAAAAVGAKSGPDAGFRNPVYIQCDSGQMQGSKQELICTGHVRVKRYSVDISCDKLIAYYANKDVNDVKHFECMGNVQAVDGDRAASSEFSDYDNETEVLVMTGHPQGRQGTSRMRGSKIIFHVNSDEMDVDAVTALLESQGQEEKRQAKKKKGVVIGSIEATDAGPAALALQNPVEIQCDRGRMEGSREQMVCVGHVRAKRHNTDMTCDRLIGHYVNRDVNEVKRIECIGNVEAVDGDRWAQSDFGDFDTANEVLVMTGHPKGRQGTNEMTGSKITFHVDSDLMDVDDVIGTLESKGQDEKRKANMKKAPPK